MNAPSRHDSLPPLGAHMSIAGGLHLALERGASIGCQTIQIFLKSNVQWKAAAYTDAAIREFHETHQRSGIGTVFAHSCYLINLGALDAKTYESSLRATADELRRAEQLGIPFIVMHPGAHLGAGEAAGLKRVAKALREIFAETRGLKAKIALETTAGQGSSLGWRFEHLAELIERGASERLAVCLDTCHVFAAGYDIRSTKGCEKTFSEFERIVGFKHLAAFHLNDSKTPLGSRVDRHEHIGKGKIGLAAFRWLMNNKKFRRVPMVLETPKEKDLAEDVVNLRVLRSLARR